MEIESGEKPKRKKSTVKIRREYIGDGSFHVGYVVREISSGRLYIIKEISDNGFLRVKLCDEKGNEKKMKGRTMSPICFEALRN